MEKQTPMEMELDFEQLDSDLRHLSPIQRQEVLAAESIGNFPPKTRAKHAYLTEKLDAGQNVFGVPAGVIAALLAQAYCYTSELYNNSLSPMVSVRTWKCFVPHVGCCVPHVGCVLYPSSDKRLSTL